MPELRSKLLAVLSHMGSNCDAGSSHAATMYNSVAPLRANSNPILLLTFHDNPNCKSRRNKNFSAGLLPRTIRRLAQPTQVVAVIVLESPNGRRCPSLVYDRGEKDFWASGQRKKYHDETWSGSSFIS